MNKERLIKDYITGRISEVDKNTFENLLENDPDFKSEFEFHNDIAAALKISEAELLKNRFQDIENSTSYFTKRPFSKSVIAYLAIGCLLIIGVLYTTFGTQSNDDLFSANFKIFPNTYQPILRGGDLNKNIAAFSAYESGDFISAEKEFERILEKNDDPNIKFYYSLSLLNQFKFDEALEEFKKLKNLNHDYKSDALWYISLIYLRKKDFENAKQNLQEIKVRDVQFKTEAVEQLLQKIKDYK